MSFESVLDQTRTSLAELEQQTQEAQDLTQTWESDDSAMLKNTRDVFADRRTAMRSTLAESNNIRRAVQKQSASDVQALNQYWHTLWQKNVDGWWIKQRFVTLHRRIVTVDFWLTLVQVGLAIQMAIRFGGEELLKRILSANQSLLDRIKAVMEKAAQRLSTAWDKLAALGASGLAVFISILNGLFIRILKLPQTWGAGMRTTADRALDVRDAVVSIVSASKQLGRTTIFIVEYRRRWARDWANSTWFNIRRTTELFINWAYITAQNIWSQIRATAHRIKVLAINTALTVQAFVVTTSRTVKEAAVTTAAVLQERIKIGWQAARTQWHKIIQTLKQFIAYLQQLSALWTNKISSAVRALRAYIGHINDQIAHAPKKPIHDWLTDYRVWLIFLAVEIIIALIEIMLLF